MLVQVADTPNLSNLIVMDSMLADAVLAEPSAMSHLEIHLM